MRNYVIINGVDSLTINGLAINELPPISKPPMRTLQEEIDGRDGDIITNLGYGSYDKIMTIGLYGGYDIDEIIAFFNGEGTIIFSNEPDKYYNYKIIEQIDYESLIKFRTATVTFHCQPFKYPVEEEPIEVDYDYIEEEGEDLTLEPTDGSPLSLTLKGNTSQYTTTGKNKIYWVSGSTSLHNLVITENSDKSLNITGTPNSTWANLTPNTLYTLPAGTYTYSINQTIPAIIGLALFTEGEAYIEHGRITSGNKSITITTTQNITRFRLYLEGLNQSTNYSIKNLQIQLEQGSQATSYEPYTGGNPAPSPDYPSPVNVVTGDNTIEVVGKNLIDSVEYNRSVSNTGSFQNGNTYLGINDYVAIEPNTTYTISFEHDISGAKLYIGYKDKNGNFISRESYSTARTFTTLGNAYYMFAYLNKSGSYFYTIGGWVQLEKDSSATDFEPYQSQTYPIYLGVENLLKYPYRDTTKTENGITFTDIGDGTIKVNGTASANTYFYLTTNNDDTYKKYNGKKLTISGCPSGGGNNTYQIGFYNDNFSVGTADNGNGGTFTGGDVRYNQAYIRINSGVQCDNLIFKPQLELGTKKNSYTPYGTTPIELCKIGDYQDKLLKSTGKNLFNIDDTSANKGYYLTSSGVEEISGNWSVYYVPIQPNTTYTISGCQTNGGAFFGWFGDNKTFISNIGQKQNRTITSPSNAKYLGLSIVWNTTSTAYDSQFMLNTGTTALPYEPYGNVWYIHKEIGKVVLNGSENWLLNSSSGDSYRYWIRNDGFTNTFTNCLIGNEGVLLDKLFNDHFTQSLFSNTAIGKFSINNDSGSRWFLLNTNITALADFKTWLSTHNTIVYYAQATPTNTEITDTTLISQLEALKGAMSYKGQTNIMQVSYDKPFIIKARTMEGGSDEAIINNVGNTYAKPTIHIEGNGIVNVYLNGNQIFAVNVTDEVVIDSTNLEAYNPNTSALENRKVTGNIANLKLNTGTSILKFSGNLTKATITDYVRYL